MATGTPSPPPPPPPPQPGPPILCPKLRCGARPPPRPSHASLPFRADGSSPVQETSPPPEAQPPTEAPPAPPLLPVQNGPQVDPPHGQEEDSGTCDGQEKDSPVQETTPAPQTITVRLTTEQQDEEMPQREQPGEDHQP